MVAQIILSVSCRRKLDRRERGERPVAVPAAPRYISGAKLSLRIGPEPTPKTTGATGRHKHSSQRNPPPHRWQRSPRRAEPQRRPQGLGSGAASAQAASACMNEQKSASVDTAIKSCDAVIDETLKNLANAYYFRASAKFGKSDFDGAIGDYGQALRVERRTRTTSTAAPRPTKPRTISTSALADYNQSIKTNPSSIYAYNNRGAVVSAQGRFRPRRRRLRRGDGLQPTTSTPGARAAGCARSARPDAAGAVGLQRGAQDQSRRARVVDTRGFVYLKLGQTDNAIKDYDAALKLDLKLAGSLYGRGIAKTRRGDATAARPTSEPPSRSNPTSPGIRALRTAVESDPTPDRCPWP